MKVEHLALSDVIANAITDHGVIVASLQKLNWILAVLGPDCVEN